MSKNNPFRTKPSANVQHDVEDWGKSKFIPKISKGGNRKYLGSNTKSPFSRKYDNRKSIFHKNQVKLPLSEVAKSATPENSTPWKKYKDEIIFKQRDEEQTSRQANIGSDEAKTILKQREINYRKSLIEQKKKEPTKWEDFAEDDGQIEKYSQTQNDSFSTKYKGSNPKNVQLKAKNTLETKPKRNKSRPYLKKDFISKDLLQNFDSKKLSFEQNDKLRKVITKTTIMASQISLPNVVNELKKKKNNQNYKNKRNR